MVPAQRGHQGRPAILCAQPRPLPGLPSPLAHPWPPLPPSPPLPSGPLCGSSTTGRHRPCLPSHSPSPVSPLHTLPPTLSPHLVRLVPGQVGIHHNAEGDGVGPHHPVSVTQGVEEPDRLLPAALQKGGEGEGGQGSRSVMSAYWRPLWPIGHRCQCALGSPPEAWGGLIPLNNPSKGHRHDTSSFTLAPPPSPP